MKKRFLENPFVLERSYLTIEDLCDLCCINKTGLVLLKFLNETRNIYDSKFHISVDDFLKEQKSLSRKSFYLGVNELIKFNVIAKTKDVNLFFINPKFFPKYYDDN